MVQFLTQYSENTEIDRSASNSFLKIKDSQFTATDMT